MLDFGGGIYHGIYLDEEDLFIGYPTVINKDGAVRRLPVKLNNEEKERFKKSIDTLSEALTRLQNSINSNQNE